MISVLDLGRIRAVLFDMDGLLLDSETVSLSTFLEACHACGVNADVDIYYKCIGVNEEGTRKILREGYGTNFPLERVWSIWHCRYEAEAASRAFPLKLGAIELLETVKGLGLRRAVVTSTRRAAAEHRMDKAGILGYFELTVGGDQISSPKPNPDIYLVACRRLGLDPHECLALEDSDNGVRAAHAAGLPVIQVPDLLEPSPEVRAIGHPIVRSLTDVRSIFRESLRDPQGTPSTDTRGAMGPDL